MSFLLSIYDVNGQEINLGDIVEVSTGQRNNVHTFYCEVKFLQDEQTIVPFHTFSWHRIKKINKLPEGLKEMDEPRYKCWYLPEEKTEEEYMDHKQYFTSWRDLEISIRDRMYRISINNQLNLF